MPEARVAATLDAMKVRLTRYPRAYDALRLPYAAARFWARKPHDPDYGVFALFPDSHGVFLDVGANAGMSALSFRVYNKTSPIVSIEPNPFHERHLRFVGRLVRASTHHMWAAGSENGELTLYVPVYRGVPLTAEASLIQEEVTDSSFLRGRLGSRMDGPDFKVVSCSVPVRPLDSLDLNPSFAKLDVQGFEHEVLLGMAKTIHRTYPVLLIETPNEMVRQYLDGLGYEAFSYSPAERRVVPEVAGRVNTVFIRS